MRAQHHCGVRAELLPEGLQFRTPVSAQTYAPGYPVCLHVYGPITYYDCSYNSIAQCNLSASGRGAQCVVNPYIANAEFAGQFGVRHTRRAY